MAKTLKSRWDGQVSKEGKTALDRKRMSKLSLLIQQMTGEQLDWYSAAVDGMVDRWNEKIRLAKQVLKE